MGIWERITATSNVGDSLDIDLLRDAAERVKDVDYSADTPEAQSETPFFFFGADPFKTEWCDPKDYAKKAQLLLEKCPISKACIDMRAQGVGGVTLIIKGGSPGTKKMLTSPNSIDKTLPAAFMAWETHLSVGGDLWLFYDKRAPGLPQTSSFRPDLMNDNVKKQRYEYIPGKLKGDQTPLMYFPYGADRKTNGGFIRIGQTETYKSFDGDCQHVSYFNPTSPFRGIGAGDAALRSVENFLACDELINRKFKSGGVRAGYFRAPNAKTNSELAALSAQVNALNPDGGMAILGSGMDWIAAQMNFSELDLVKIRDKSADAICSAFRVNSTMVNVGEATHANLRGMDKIFYRNFIGPEAKWLVGQLEWGIRNYLGDTSISLEIDETDIQHIQDDILAAVTQIGMLGIATVDELRAQVGLPPLGPSKGGDALVGAKPKNPDATGLGQPDTKPGGETAFNADSGNRGDKNP